MKFYKSIDEKAWYNFKPENLTNLVEITEEEWNQHIIDITPTEPNQEELEKRGRIAELKSLLSSTDYLAIKYAEGQLSETEYAPTKAQRQEWRNEINRLEQ